MIKLFENVKRVMVFCSHGDDEIIGPGSTIYGLSQNETEIIVITFTKRETSYARVEDKNIAAVWAEKEMAAADKILGIKKRIVLGLPNHGVVNDRDNFQICVKLIRKYRPDIIFTHGPYDQHRDHRAVSELVDGASAKAGENLSPDWGMPHRTGLVLYFEIFDLFTKPHIIVPVEERWLDKKLEAMRAQVSQLEVLENVEDYIKGLAAVRGRTSGSKYAEAFRISDFNPSLAQL